MSSPSDRWLPWYAYLTALATLGLVCLGGLVTSKGVGMSVPDWPTSFGYNMFALPVSQWFHGGVFDEHTHRLWASMVGLMVVFLTRWLGGRAARRPLAIIGATEIFLGIALLGLGPDWRGAGHFLAGIGGVVLLAAVVWHPGDAREAPLPALGWLAFWAVQLQGLLGGLRVVLDQWTLGNVTLGLLLGLVHGCLGQAFLVLLGVIALRVSPFWSRLVRSGSAQVPHRLAVWVTAGTVLIVLQLILGASMRHQHSGLAIPDFPTAYGRWWPALDDAALLRYNQNRIEDSTVTAFQIVLQLLHRLGAVGVLVAVAMACRVGTRCAALPRAVMRGLRCWLGLVCLQAGLGAATIWTNKAADVATAHVAIGALSLLIGTWLILVLRKLSVPARVRDFRETVAPLAQPFAR